jgi:hypothetical protein
VTFGVKWNVCVWLSFSSCASQQRKKAKDNTRRGSTHTQLKHTPVMSDCEVTFSQFYPISLSITSYVYPPASHDCCYVHASFAYTVIDKGGKEKASDWKDARKLKEEPFDFCPLSFLLPLFQLSPHMHTPFPFIVQNSYDAREQLSGTAHWCLSLTREKKWNRKK